MRTSVASAPHVRAGVTVTILALGAILFATLRPGANPPLASHWCLICGTQGGVDAILNVLLFVPLGIGLGLKGTQARFVIPSAFLLSIGIELSQLTLIVGRDATVGDVVTNTAGAALGFAVARYSVVLLRPSRRAALTLTGGWCIVWLGLNAVLSFAFVEAIPGSYFYGQLARRLGNFDWFSGRVLVASVGPVPIPDSRIANSGAIHDLLVRGAPITASVLPVGPTRGIAPIVRVVDSAGREAVMVGQLGTALVFGLRSGAAALKLRPPIFGSDSVFGFPGNPDLPQPAASSVSPRTRSMNLTARYARTSVVLNANGAGVVVGKEIPIAPTLGWVLLLPVQWVVEGSGWETVISVLWVVCMVLLPSYWSAFVGPRSKAQRQSSSSITWPLAVAVVVLIGLDVIPRFYGVGAAGAAVWISSLIAVLCGHFGGSLVRSRAPDSTRTDLSA